jgi:transposase
MEGRSMGLDLHRDFCEVAAVVSGKVERWPRVSARPVPVREFAEQQLRPTDRVALEATSNSLAIARIIRPHVAEVVIVNTRQLQAIANSKQKTDRHDARTLAQLLAAGMLEHSWLPDENTRATRRRTSRRASLVVARAKCKNDVLAVLNRNLKNRPPMTDASGVAGREWLAGQPLPADERDTIDGALRQIDFLTEEITTIEHDLAQFVLASPDARRLLTVPGVGMITAGVFLAQIGTARGDINRFTSPQRLAGYLGLDPRVDSPATGPDTPVASEGGRRWRPTRARRICAHRSALTRAAARVLRADPRLARTSDRDRRDRPQDRQAVLVPPRPRRGLGLHAPDRAREEDPNDRAQSRPRASLPWRNRTPLNRDQRRAVERQIAEHAEAAYERTVTDWQRAAQARKVPARA